MGEGSKERGVPLPFCPLENFSLIECPHMPFGVTKVNNCEVNFLLKNSFSLLKFSDIFPPPLGGPCPPGSASDLL